MEVEYMPDAELDLQYWINTGNKYILKKIAQLVENILQTPYQGIGKPEALKYELSGLWSRHINKEHRLVYEIRDNTLYERAL